jgi:hypothetical protein
MILGGLESAERWQRLHPGFAAAFTFRRRVGLEQLAEGRAVDGAE